MTSLSLQTSEYFRYPLVFSSGELARQANASIKVVFDETIVLVAVCMSSVPKARRHQHAGKVLDNYHFSLCVPLWALRRRLSFQFIQRSAELAFPFPPAVGWASQEGHGCATGGLERVVFLEDELVAVLGQDAAGQEFFARGLEPLPG